MGTFSKTSSQDSCTTHHPLFNSAKPTIMLTSAPVGRHSISNIPAQNSKSSDTTSPDRTTKCATVTMMLAERIIRNDWSVEEEHFFESINMNVWQTIEFLSSVNARKRYNYEGYNDANTTASRTLASSWRRDSFVEKNVNPNGDQSTSTSNGKYSTVANGTLEMSNNNESDNDNGSSAAEGNQFLSAGHSKSSKSKRNALRRRGLKTNIHQKNKLAPEYILSPSDYSDLIKCTFTLPRISAALERLMGTNVVRLTDRNYMKELRERIEDDYRANLQKRIKARELKEVERERVLIIEGKTSVIPEELADDPIFVVNKKADLEIATTRAKLKTNREKNSERLKLQGVKWERERLQHEEDEAERINVMRQRYKEQRDLEEKYKDEDDTRGMDLLRIQNEDWRPCEQQLKEFLEQERYKMKERSLRIPTPFNTDPKDIKNILKARKAFRDVERRIRKAIEDKHQENLKQQLVPYQQKSGQQHIGIPDILGQQGPLTESQTTKDFFESIDLENTHMQTTLTSDDDSYISSGEPSNASSSISFAKQRYAGMLQQELENDVAEGLVISKDQYDQLRYEDDKIMQLRNAQDIRELYHLAEEIIIGDHLENYDDEEEEAIAEEEEEEREIGKQIQPEFNENN